MLRALFEAIESTGGQRLASAADVLYGLGFALVVWRCVAGVGGGLLDGSAARRGLRLGWTVQCPVCAVRTVAGASCEKCGVALGIPLAVRLWSRVKAPQPFRSSGLAFALGMIGAAAFVAVSLAAALSVDALSPEGVLERLFLGSAALAWAGTGFLLGRAFSLSGVGPLSRIRGLAFGAGTLCLALLAALLAQAARPPQTREIAELRVEQDAVQIFGQRLVLANGEVGLQYQLVESPTMGWAFTVPLAVVGAAGTQLLALPHRRLEGWLLDESWKRAESLGARGIVVKRRIESFRVSSGETYGLKLGAREPSLEKRP